MPPREKTREPWRAEWAERRGESAEGPRGESPEGVHGEPAEGGVPGSGGEDFGADEARSDLREARVEVRVIIDELLAGVDGREKVVVREVKADVETVDRLLVKLADVLESGESAPAGLVCSVILRVEMAREAAKNAADQAEGELRGVLDRVLGKLGKIGQELLSMSLHLFPVREWSLGGEVSALFVKGSISVTFGK